MIAQTSIPRKRHHGWNAFIIFEGQDPLIFIYTDTPAHRSPLAPIPIELSAQFKKRVFRLFTNWSNKRQPNLFSTHSQGWLSSTGSQSPYFKRSAAVLEDIDIQAWKRRNAVCFNQWLDSATVDGFMAKRMPKCEGNYDNPIINKIQYCSHKFSSSKMNSL